MKPSIVTLKKPIYTIVILKRQIKKYVNSIFTFDNLTDLPTKGGRGFPMSAVQRFHEAANDALVRLSEQCLPGAKLALVIYTPGEPERDIVIEDQGLDRDEVVSALRRRGLSIDGDNAYKRDLLDSVVGAMAFGVQNHNPPPADHWGQRFWDIGREERAQAEELLVDLQEAASTLRRYKALHRAKGTAESTERAEVNARLASRFEQTISKATR